MLSVFLFVIHQCRQRKAERVTTKAITRVLLCPLKIILLPHSLLELRVSPLQPGRAGAGPEPQSRLAASALPILPGTGIFLMSRRGVGGEVGSTVGASRAAEGWEHPIVFPGGGCSYVHGGRLLDGLVLGCVRAGFRV